MKKNNVKDYFLISILLGLMYMDYILTYYGVYYFGVVYEMNPLMTWLFDCENISLFEGLIIRILMTMPFMGILICFVKHNCDVELKLALVVGFALNITVMILHYRWITLYLL